MCAECLVEANTLMNQSRLLQTSLACEQWPRSVSVSCNKPSHPHTSLFHFAFCCFTHCFLLSPLFTSCTRRPTYISVTLKHMSAL